MKNYKAKSDGTTLLEHSTNVKNISIKIAEKTLNDNFINYITTLEHSSLLHDIGKLTNSFQNKLNNKKYKKNKYSHNEIGWAFLTKYYKSNVKDDVLYIVFWHHGIYNNFNKIEDNIKILESLSDNEISRMSDYLIETIGEKYLSDNDNMVEPEKYYNTNNANLHILRILYSCVISADRIASSIATDNIDEYVNSYLNMTQTYNATDNWEYKNSNRSKKQIEISNQCKGTTMLNAPAGFGKTIMGLLWGLKRKRKIIWVCPRNIIAESVYENVKEELSKMHISPTIELILHGDVIYGPYKDPYKSDIIITNIDNYIAPSNNNNLLLYNNLINSASVIFDEYQELITKSALFAAFILIMKGRNLLTNSETLLLSATPNMINHLWEGNKFYNKPTQILPNNNKHFNAQHNNPFKFKIKENQKNIDNIQKTNSLVIYNSISDSQKAMYNGKYEKLIHSLFTDNKKKDNLKYLLNNFGKYKHFNNNNNIVGTHILQASLDISFKHVYESVFSPDSTLQRLGRNNRWGDINDSTFTSIMLNNKSDKSTIDFLFDKDIQKLWFEHIKKYNNKLLTLNDFYNLYNDFYKKHDKKIKYYIERLYKKSNKNLEQIYPIKYYNKSKKQNITAGSNKLRSNGNDIFYIVKNNNTNKWIGLFTEEIRDDIDKQFNEDGNTLNKIIKEMKKINNLQSYDFDYSKILNKNKYSRLTNYELIRNAKISITPYIRFDRLYNDTLGVIKKDVLENLKK